MAQAFETSRKGRGRRVPAGGASPRLPRLPPRLSLRNRYSMFVGLMKVVLPAMAAALILLVIAWPQLTKDRSRFTLGVANLGQDQIETLSMLNARYDGIDDKNRPFTLSADVATQSPRNDQIVDLELPKADMTMTDGAWLALTARAGRYNRESEQLDLAGNVSLFHDKGFELRTEYARIDLKRGIATGDQPVEGQGGAGTINAEGFRVSDRGQRILFTGRSHLVLRPQAQEAMR